MSGTGKIQWTPGNANGKEEFFSCRGIEIFLWQMFVVNIDKKNPLQFLRGGWVCFLCKKKSI
jgi:hypothetical protein